MSEMEIILKEKNATISNLTAELLKVKSDCDVKIATVREKSEGMITKKSAANDIYNRLNKLKIMAYVGIVAPPLAGIVGGINLTVGGAVGLVGGVICTFFFKKEIKSELDRLKSKYGL